MIRSFFALELDKFAITLSSKELKSAIIRILPLGAAMHRLTNLACGDPVAGWFRLYSTRVVNSCQFSYGTSAYYYAG